MFKTKVKRSNWSYLWVEKTNVERGLLIKINFDCTNEKFAAAQSQTLSTSEAVNIIRYIMEDFLIFNLSAPHPVWPYITILMVPIINVRTTLLYTHRPLRKKTQLQQ